MEEVFAMHTISGRMMALIKEGRDLDDGELLRLMLELGRRIKQLRGCDDGEMLDLADELDRHLSWLEEIIYGME